MIKQLTYLLAMAFIFLFQFLMAQSSSEVFHDLKKLRETKRVLYVAAHPDDENTRLISYLANKENVQIAYLSLTRGDGGQNLIGKELGIELGMIRTQELLRARETDGGRQYFTRAKDFGYSRNPEETLNNWDREELLSDIIWVIRKFQPDIIITRFNTTPGTTHGHHTTSAILAEEAFEKSGDPKVYPEHLKWHQPWKARRLFWNAYSWGGKYEPKKDKIYHNFPVGEWNPLLGTTYSKIAADSRTMHKSQGFGATAQIGEGEDFVELVIGEPFQSGPFEGIDSRWGELENGEIIEEKINGLLQHFDFVNPSNNLVLLVEIKALLDKIKADLPWVKEKRDALNHLILKVLGFQSLYLANKELSFPTDQVTGKLILNNPSDQPVILKRFQTLGFDKKFENKISGNDPFNLEINLSIPENSPISQPYWLEKPIKDNLYTVENQQLIGMPFNQPAITGKITLEIKDQLVDIKIPLQYRYNDQVDGEVIQPFTVLPEITIETDQKNVFLLNGKTSLINITVNFENNIKEGELGFEGLSSSQFTLLKENRDPDNKRIDYVVELLGQNGPEKSIITAYFKTQSGRVYQQEKNRIIYDHIPNLTYFQASSFNLIQLDMDLSQQRIGYIPGAGDEVPGVLSNLGYQVEMLENGNFTQERLSTYSTIIVGIRAFNVNQELANNINDLMTYVRQGGNLIVQYNTIGPLLTKELGPFPLEVSRDRITVEGSPVKISKKDHPALLFPNKIIESDFDGWVQERGLYFPGSWDEKYQTPLIMQDPKEEATQGALLLADYGSGKFTYSGISWFRLLPAGVPGAIKLFVNLIEQNSEKRERISTME